MYVFAKFLKRVALRNTSGDGRNFGPVASFIGLMHNDLEVHNVLRRQSLGFSRQ